MKIIPVGNELFHANNHDGADSRFSQRERTHYGYVLRVITRVLVTFVSEHLTYLLYLCLQRRSVSVTLLVFEMLRFP